MVDITWTCSSGGGDKKYIQDFNGETSSVVITWKTEKEILGKY
jgi:hypothetical protein